MGRMSDVDIDTRETLEEEMRHEDFNEYDRAEYITKNYDRVAKSIINKLADAARLV